MSQTSSLQTLDLILEDISAEINLAINSLDQFRKNPKLKKALTKSFQHLNKVKGVFNLLEMPAAKRLVEDAAAIIKGLGKCQPSTKQRLLVSLSVALVRLIRYLEHTNQRNRALPQLLLPTINELRQSINAPHLAEAVFFECDCNVARSGKKVAMLVSEEVAKKSRHYRQMYQIGLIEVLRQTNMAGGMNMMKRAMIKLDDECPRYISPNLWWIAQGLLDAFLSDSLVLTKARLKLFSRLDRQIRNIENKPINRRDNDKLESRLLAKEMLYLTWISQLNNPLVKQMFEHFQISNCQFNEQQIREEYEELRGPSDQDYSSMVDALLEEITRIEETLTHSVEETLQIADLKQALSQMIALNNLLKILQVDDQIIRLSVAIDLVSKAIEGKEPLSEKDSNILFLVLKKIRDSVDESKLAKYSGKNRQTRNRINSQQQEICGSTQELVKQLIAKLDLFIRNDRSRQHLAEVPDLLAQIKTGFESLEVAGSTSILEGCITFVNYHLMRNPHKTEQQSIELFADIIGSLEFYLETLEYTAEPSSRILSFAENSLQQLKAA